MEKQHIVSYQFVDGRHQFTTCEGIIKDLRSVVINDETYKVVKEPEILVYRSPINDRTSYKFFIEVTYFDGLLKSRVDISEIIKTGFEVIAVEYDLSEKID